MATAYTFVGFHCFFIVKGEVRRDLKHMYMYIRGGVIGVSIALYQLSMLLPVLLQLNIDESYDIHNGLHCEKQ